MLDLLIARIALLLSLAHVYFLTAFSYESNLTPKDTQHQIALSLRKFRLPLILPNLLHKSSNSI